MPERKWKMRHHGWISAQALPDTLAKLLLDGFEIELKCKPGTGDVQLTATQYGDPIKVEPQ